MLTTILALTLMNTIKVPYIPELETMAPETFVAEMDGRAAAGRIGEVNWPDAFPYSPDCTFLIARSDGYLAISYLVTGRDLRATQMEDGGRSWEDSCCEFFIACPDGEYCNVETTCIGSVLMAKGPDRNSRAKFTETGRIIRRSTLEHKPYDITGGEHSWRLDILIPLDMIGLDPLPAEARCNFYKCADKTATPHFVSWSPIETPKPDFHRPEHFGKLIF